MEKVNKIFLEYELRSELLCIGERTKKGTFKPCVKTIPYSSITYALRNTLERDDIHAAGMLDEKYLSDIDKHRGIHVYSPRHRYEDVAKVPLNIEYLIDVVGRVYVLFENKIDPKASLEINMGAFRSKGFGRCSLVFKGEVEAPAVKRGILFTRIPEKHFDAFGITRVEKPVYGYLFEPKDILSGRYVKSVFEGSIVMGYDFLLKKER